MAEVLLSQLEVAAAAVLCVCDPYAARLGRLGLAVAKLGLAVAKLELAPGMSQKNASTGLAALEAADGAFLKKASRGLQLSSPSAEDLRLVLPASHKQMTAVLSTVTHCLGPAMESIPTQIFFLQGKAHVCSCY